MKNHPDQKPYAVFTKRQRVDKAVHTLEGLLKGVAIDRRLNTFEAQELQNWCQEHHELIGKHPFTELVPRIKDALSDGSLDAEEQADLIWLCGNLSTGSVFYEEVTSDIQVLHGILHGILADGVISHDEANGLRQWMTENSHLQGSYPFDELDSLLTTALRDGRLDEKEQSLLKDFFEDFIVYSGSRHLVHGKVSSASSNLTRLPAVCAVCPDIQFPDRRFCFTGASAKALRRDLEAQIAQRRGLVRASVSMDLDYLVVGAAGNPCWAFACYGRKVEQAVNLRKNGHRLTIVHEHDFWDAIQDSAA